MRLTLDDGIEIEIASGPEEQGRARRLDDDGWVEAPTVLEALARLANISEDAAGELIEKAMVARGAVQRTHVMGFKPRDD
jgi:hypothetical protein